MMASIGMTLLQRRYRAGFCRRCLLAAFSLEMLLLPLLAQVRVKSD